MYIVTVAILQFWGAELVFCLYYRWKFYLHSCLSLLLLLIISSSFCPFCTLLPLFPNQTSRMQSTAEEAKFLALSSSGTDIKMWEGLFPTILCGLTLARSTQRCFCHDTVSNMHLGNALRTGVDLKKTCSSRKKCQIRRIRDSSNFQLVLSVLNSWKKALE